VREQSGKGSFGSPHALLCLLMSSDSQATKLRRYVMRMKGSECGRAVLSFQTERQQVPQVSVRFHEQGRQSHLVWFVGSGQVFFSAHYPRFSSRTYTRTVFTRYFQR
jgi:hypothetical protein